MNDWKKTYEYFSILDFLETFWLSEPDEEFVRADLFFRHKDGREKTFSICWFNPSLASEEKWAIWYKEEVKKSGLKLGYVADQMGVSRQTLWAKLNGKSRLTEDDMRNLNAILMVNVDQHDHFVVERNSNANTK